MAVCSDELVERFKGIVMMDNGWFELLGGPANSHDVKSGGMVEQAMALQEGGRQPRQTALFGPIHRRSRLGRVSSFGGTHFDDYQALAIERNQVNFAEPSDVVARQQSIALAAQKSGGSALRATAKPTPPPALADQPFTRHARLAGLRFLRFLALAFGGDALRLAITIGAWGWCGFYLGLALAQTSGLPNAVAEIVELGAARSTGALNFDLGDLRRVEREDALDAFTLNDAADSKRFADTAAFARYDRTREDLGPLLLPFKDALVDVNNVTDLKLRGAGLEAARFRDADQSRFHGRLPSCPAQPGRESVPSY